MRQEFLAILRPFRLIENAAIQAVDRAISHGEGMVGVVMREKALPSEGQQALDSGNPAVENFKMRLVVAIVDRISVRQTARERACDLRGLRKPAGAKPAIKRLAETVVIHRPMLVAGIAR